VLFSASQHLGLEERGIDGFLQHHHGHGSWMC
jgi:hypothetical protein